MSKVESTKMENPMFLVLIDKAPGLEMFLNLQTAAIQSRMLFSARFKTVSGKH